MIPTLVIQEHLPAGETLSQRMEAALAAGFDGLEVRDARRERHAELREALAVGGIMPTGCPPGDAGFLADFDAGRRNAARDRMRRELHGLGELGGYGVISPAAWGMWTNRLPPFDPPPRTPDEDREVLLEQLSALAEDARESGVLVLLEALNRYEDHMINSVAQACEIVAAVGSDSVRVLADTYHMNIEEDDLCAALRAAAPLLGAVHLSDSNRHQPGLGHVDFPRVLETLRDIGYAGSLSIECRLRGVPEEAVPTCGAYLRRLLTDWS